MAENDSEPPRGSIYSSIEQLRSPTVLKLRSKLRPADGGAGGH